MNMHASGIYFGLGEAEYHADPALGSTDLKRLMTSASDYWWHSHYNPARPADTDSPAKAMGRAVHVAVLYGLDEFTRRYGRCQYPGNITAGKREREDMIDSGREPMAAERYDRAFAAATMIRKNPEIGTAFSDGAAEVSVFWEQEIDGEMVRRKARFDYLRRKAIVDLKSHAPMDGWDFVTSCHRALKTFKYPVQAAAYMQALPAVRELWKDGQVHGVRAEEGALLHDVVNGEQKFVFIFWASEGAPLTWGGVFSPDNGEIQVANSMVDAALHRFVQYRREFGTDAAWIKPEPLQEIDPQQIHEWWRRETA